MAEFHMMLPFAALVAPKLKGSLGSCSPPPFHTSAASAAELPEVCVLLLPSDAHGLPVSGAGPCWPEGDTKNPF